MRKVNGIRVVTLSEILFVMILSFYLSRCFYAPATKSRGEGGILIYPCQFVRPSVRPDIDIHGLFGYLLLQFKSYRFHILQNVYTHNGGMHVHRILIFVKYPQNDR